MWRDIRGNHLIDHTKRHHLPQVRIKGCQKTCLGNRRYPEGIILFFERILWWFEWFLLSRMMIAPGWDEKISSKSNEPEKGTTTYLVVPFSGSLP
jgi:hypothetical protein